LPLIFRQIEIHFFLLSFSLFFVSLAMFYITLSIFNKESFNNRNYLILDFLIFISLSLSLIEVFKPEIFIYIREYLWGVSKDLDNLIRRVEEVGRIRPALIFNEESDFAIFISLIFALRSCFKNFKFIHIFIFMIFVFLVRSPSIFIFLPVIFFKFINKKVLIYPTLFFAFTLFIKRIDYIFHNFEFNNSLLERVYYPFLYFMNDPFGFGAGNLTQVNNFVCTNLNFFACSENSANASSSIFMNLIMFGLPFFLLYLLLIYKFFGKNYLLIVTTSFFFVGLFATMYNSPRFFLLFAISISLLLTHDKNKL